MNSKNTSRRKNVQSTTRPRAKAKPQERVNEPGRVAAPVVPAKPQEHIQEPSRVAAPVVPAKPQEHIPEPVHASAPAVPAKPQERIQEPGRVAAPAAPAKPQARVPEPGRGAAPVVPANPQVRVKESGRVTAPVVPAKPQEHIQEPSRVAAPVVPAKPQEHIQEPVHASAPAVPAKPQERIQEPGRVAAPAAPAKPQARVSGAEQVASHSTLKPNAAPHPAAPVPRPLTPPPAPALPWKNSWRGYAVSTPGSGHLRYGIPCQDASGVWLENRPALIVCDGRGSAKLSHFGARRAVAAFRRQLAIFEPFMVNILDQVDAKPEQWLKMARLFYRTLFQEQKELAAEHQAAPKEFDFTVVFAVAGQYHIGAFQVGDGALVLRQNGRLQSAFLPEKGEFSNQTHFLREGGENGEHFQCALFDATVNSGIAATSDGPEYLMFQLFDMKPGRIFDHFFDELGAEELTEQEVRDYLTRRVWYDDPRGADDRSLAVLRCLAPRSTPKPEVKLEDEAETEPESPQAEPPQPEPLLAATSTPSPATAEVVTPPPAKPATESPTKSATVPDPAPATESATEPGAAPAQNALAHPGAWRARKWLVVAVGTGLLVSQAWCGIQCVKLDQKLQATQQNNRELTQQVQELTVKCQLLIPSPVTPPPTPEKPHTPTPAPATMR